MQINHFFKHNHANISLENLGTKYPFTVTNCRWLGFTVLTYIHHRNLTVELM